ncbi:structural protein [Caudoviricetes sp.]|nr:structural protein [Caudoviricetes sp.]
MKIIDPDDLVVSSTFGNLGVDGNIWLDTTAKTFTLAAFGVLVAKDGVTGNAIWAKFVDLWTTASYQPFPFPMNVLDARSGQYIFGQDPGGSFNGWKPANDATRQMVRDAGWSEYSAAGVLNRQYVGIVALASGFPAGGQFYYQRASGGSAANFTFTDAPNEGIQVFGDASNGNFDTRTYFKLFCREADYTYDDAILSDVGESSTGAFKIALPISVGSDLKITDNDATVASSAPYTSIDVEYFAVDQNKTIGGGSYPFRVIIDNVTAAATLEEIYTKIQYLLRQAGDIDSGAGTVTGKTANALCYFVGDTLYTTQGVFIDGVIPADLNRIVFLDQNSVERTYPFASAGALNFSSNLVTGAAGYFRMYFTNDDAGNNAGADYGTSSAITVNDKDGNPIQGTISGAQIAFTYDYDGNVQRGAASAGDDAPITIVAGNAGYAKPVVATGTISRSKGISITLTAETDRAYIV